MVLFQQSNIASSPARSAKCLCCPGATAYFFRGSRRTATTKNILEFFPDDLRKTFLGCLLPFMLQEDVF